MKQFIGKRVIVRSDRAGVFFGTLDSIDGESVVMSNVRKLVDWGDCNIEKVATDGVATPIKCLFSTYVSLVSINEVYSVYLCTKKCIESIERVS